MRSARRANAGRCLPQHVPDSIEFAKCSMLKGAETVRAKSSSGQMFPNLRRSRSASANRANPVRNRPSFLRSRPSSTSMCPNKISISPESTKFGPPSLARFRPSLAPSRPLLAELGRLRPRLARTRPNLGSNRSALAWTSTNFARTYPHCA